MPTYVTLLKYTQQGVQNIEDSPNRLDNFRKLVESQNGEIKSVFLTMGRYDLVCVLEFPDDATTAATILRLSSMGNVSTETLKAFPEDEYRDVIANLP